MNENFYKSSMWVCHTYHIEINGKPDAEACHVGVRSFDSVKKSIIEMIIDKKLNDGDYVAIIKTAFIALGNGGLGVHKVGEKEVSGFQYNPHYEAESIIRLSKSLDTTSIVFND